MVLVPRNFSVCAELLALVSRSLQFLVRGFPYKSRYKLATVLLLVSMLSVVSTLFLYILRSKVSFQYFIKYFSEFITGVLSNAELQNFLQRVQS